MNTAVIGLLAETSIHPGAGRDTGFVDLPVAREGATDYPVIVGSSFKGALLDHVRTRDKGVDKDRQNEIFGEENSAGSLVVSDARLVLLPVRSMTGHYKWVTCPHLIERLERDLQRSREKGQPIAFGDIENKHYLGGGDKPLYLEERQFQPAGGLPEGLVDLLSSLVLHEKAKNRLAGQVVVLSNDDFTWFARFGLNVNARNQLDEVKKTSKNLWYEETIPPDSLFYCLFAERRGEAVSTITGIFEDTPYLQVGGNASVGQGWFAVKEYKGGKQ